MEQSRRLYLIFGTIITLLLVPFIAMYFTDAVNWTLSDFAIAGILLTIAGLSFEIIIRKVTKQSFKIAFIIALIIVFILLWIELAVGIFGSPWAGS